MVAPRLEADDVQDGSQGKECLGTDDGAKDPSLGLSFRETMFVEGEAGSTKQSEQETNNGGEDSRLLLPSCAGIERALVALIERLRGYDRANAPPKPGGNSGTRDLNVLGNGVGAATDDMFAQPVVVGAPCTWCLRDSKCHRRRISCDSKKLNDIKGAALANKKFRMSACSAGLAPSRRRNLQNFCSGAKI
jgi:hypothetical protein